jgi:putative transposase
MDPEDLELMRLTDEQYLKASFFGSCSMARQLHRQARRVNPERSQWLMGIEAVYHKPQSDRAHPHLRIYPYLLRDLSIDHANQAGAADITYVPMPRGSTYLLAIIGCYSQRILSSGIRNTLEWDFSIEALQQALSRYGRPEIFNTDQGAQFNSRSFNQVLEDHGVSIGMEGRGQSQDSFSLERLWRTSKPRYLYLYSISSGSELRAGLSHSIRPYNHQRRHSSLGGHTPDEVYHG